MTLPSPIDLALRTPPSDLDYALRRSETEALRSLAAQDPRAAAAHRALGLLHAAHAIAGLAATGDTPVDLLNG